MTPATASLTIPLTEKEQEALQALAQKLELTPEKVMLQALRLYQLTREGYAEVVFTQDIPKAWEATHTAR